MPRTRTGSYRLQPGHLLAALGAGAVIALALAQFAAGSWRAFERETEAKAEAIRARSTMRSPVRGPGRAGDAWMHYRRALLAFRRDGMDRAVRELRLGAECTTANAEVAWVAFDSGSAPPVIDCCDFATAAASRADTVAAALDLTMFGRDLFAVGLGISTKVGRHAIELGLGVLDALPAGSASRAEWASALEALTRIRSSLPSLDEHLEAWELGVRLTALEAGSVESADFGRSLLGALQRPFVPRGVERATEAARRIVAAADGSDPAASRALVAEAAELLRTDSMFDVVDSTFLNTFAVELPLHVRSVGERFATTIGRLARRAH